MSEQHENPFASPLTSEADDLNPAFGIQNDLVVDGGQLRAVIGAEFPDRCVKCNAPTNGYRLKRTLSWHRPLIYILLLVAWPLYILVALATRKHASFSIGLCKEHRSKRSRFRTICLLLALLALLCTVLSFPLEFFELGLWSLIGGIVVLLIGVFGSQVISAGEITNDYALIKGCGSEFLASLT